MSLLEPNSARDCERPPGYLIDDLGYLTEIQAAAALGITAKTLIEYRQAGTGPQHVELARKIYYGPRRLAEWLDAGGARLIEDK